MVFDAQDVGADAFAAESESVAIAPQLPVTQDHPVVAVGPVNVNRQGLLADELEPLGFGLIPVRLGDEAVQVGLQHGPLIAPPEQLKVYSWGSGG
ncbi:MAG TPA: hypothetical protein VFA49_09040 [Chloroflexota bacterium]|nr:hypothetical protein [Chloroflexota bacterium]